MKTTRHPECNEGSPPIGTISNTKADIIQLVRSKLFTGNPRFTQDDMTN